MSVKDFLFGDFGAPAVVGAEILDCHATAGGDVDGDRVGTCGGLDALEAASAECRGDGIRFFALCADDARNFWD